MVILTKCYRFIFGQVNTRGDKNILREVLTLLFCLMSMLEDTKMHLFSVVLGLNFYLEMNPREVFGLSRFCGKGPTDLEVKEERNSQGNVLFGL